jgi:hypothetical protein
LAATAEEHKGRRPSGLPPFFDPITTGFDGGDSFAVLTVIKAAL